MGRIIRAFFGVGLVTAGLLVVGVTSVSAQSSQTTNFTLTVGTAISLSGLGANYSATTPAGVTTPINTGPVTVSTNDGNGYTLSLSGSSAVFQGANPANSFSITDDTVAICAADFSTCATGVPMSVSMATVIKTTSVATSGDTFGVQHQIAVPGSQPADTYTWSVTYTATPN